MDNERYDELVEAIYDAALNPECWDIAVSGLKDAFNSIAAGFFVQTADQRLEGAFFHGLDHDEMVIYGKHFARNNPWFTLPGLMRPGRVLTDLSLEKIHNDSRAFLNTEMCQEWCKKQGFRHAMGGSLLDRHGNLLNFSFFRSQQAGYYTDAEIKRYQTLCRHLMKAVDCVAIFRETRRDVQVPLGSEKLATGMPAAGPSRPASVTTRHTAARHDFHK